MIIGEVSTSKIFGCIPTVENPKNSPILWYLVKESEYHAELSSTEKATSVSNTRPNPMATKFRMLYARRNGSIANKRSRSVYDSTELRMLGDFLQTSYLIKI